MLVPGDSRQPFNPLSCQNTANQASKNVPNAANFKSASTHIKSTSESIPSTPLRLKERESVLQAEEVKSCSKSRRSQSQNWIPAELSELHKCVNLSDQASIADWADALEPFDRFGYSPLRFEEEESMVLGEDHREMVVLADPVDETIDPLNAGFLLEQSEAPGRDVGSLNQQFADLQASEGFELAKWMEAHATPLRGMGTPQMSRSKQLL